MSAHSTCIPASSVAAKFRKLGWLVRAVGKHVCPNCQVSDRNHNPNPQEGVMAPPLSLKDRLEQPKAQPAKEPAKAERSIAAKSAIPLLYMALDEGYDRAGQDYKPGYSDERIAKETGLAVEFVRARRESDFGPIRDPKAVALIGGLNDLGGLAIEFRALSARVESKLNELRALALKN
ncbi:hypothetical protein GJ654_10200 [Rhodoblastus acidophilus]|uniref:Uncharacterized protein n=1 Tax=Rhodoblastus acidophilus TaxID=1074 RepID=A0A6N8DRB3_RHOAC|nr:hypothetical protein [Rhodoblastus acidophilus]MCW2275094.1 hypothetical protein [Rhodoblastus acidophilus]MTV31364.1 hypothetical protein [Rhodoblastus acidophilus]